MELQELVELVVDTVELRGGGGAWWWRCCSAMLLSWSQQPAAGRGSQWRLLTSSPLGWSSVTLCRRETGARKFWKNLELRKKVFPVQ